MDEKERRSAFLSALTTEHFVLQTAASATVSESAARASIYILALSSTLVAMGFASQSREAFGPFIVRSCPPCSCSASSPSCASWTSPWSTNGSSPVLLTSAAITVP